MQSQKPWSAIDCTLFICGLSKSSTICEKMPEHYEKKNSFQWLTHFQMGINFLWEITDFLTAFNYQRTWTPLKHLTGLLSHSSMCPCSVVTGIQLSPQDARVLILTATIHALFGWCTMEPARSGMPKLLRGSAGNVWLRTQSGWFWTPTSDRASSVFHVGGT